MKIKRQGDLLFVTGVELPTSEFREEAPINGAYILAYGEVTGHSHRLVAVQDAPLPKLKWFGDMRYLEAEAPSRVIHQEHGAIDLPAGVTLVLRQYESHAKIVHMVAD
jgi:hypothetical protein